MRDWWTASWNWFSASFDDGSSVQTTIFVTGGRTYVFGYEQNPHHHELRPVTDATIDTRFDRHGLPTQATIVVADGARYAIEPIAHGPVQMEALGRVAHMPRSMVRVRTDDGRFGLGWIEWNQPVEEPSGAAT